VTPFLVEAGHEAIAVDLPGDDETAGLPRYTELVVDAIGSRPDVVLVAGSLGGFTAPLVCERVPVRELVLVNAMIPDPGETASEWWAHTGALKAQDEAARAGGYGRFDVATYFCTMSTPRSRPRASRISAPRPTSSSDRYVTSRRGRQSGFVF
jgi:pimeloyl-ACP methyl ester carboxylesterase